MRVLVAPCSFKESLTANAACAILAASGRRFGHDVDEAPLADGGEGTLDALARPLGLTLVASDIRPMRPGGFPGAASVRSARFGIAGALAVVEAAEAIGLGLVEKSARDPLTSTTHGLGDLANAAVAAGATDVIVALGGSATVDGGAGFLETWRGGASLTGLVDVDVPLAGARMFMAQKFAGPVDDAVLDALTASLLARFPPHIAALPGAGAAGGLGAALASLGAPLVSGAGFVMDKLDVDARIARADLVVTGEGRVDAQTARGKLVASLAASCRRHSKRLVAFSGAAVADADRAALASAGVDDVVTVSPPGQGLDEALRAAAANLSRAADALFARER